MIKHMNAFSINSFVDLIFKRVSVTDARIRYFLGANRRCRMPTVDTRRQRYVQFGHEMLHLSINVVRTVLGNVTR